jgi:hypothetical protein
MSASNWAVCPRCLTRAREAANKKLAAVMATYGKVPVEQFDAARAAIEPIHEQDHATFREDYEIYGAKEGAITVSYSGHCEKCGLGLDFTEHKPLPVNEP